MGINLAASIGVYALAHLGSVRAGGVIFGETGRVPIRAIEALWPADHQRRIDRPDTWPHRPALQKAQNHPCRRRAVHTGSEAEVDPVLLLRAS